MIDGRWRRGSGDAVTVIDPATGDPAFAVEMADASQLDEAVAAAQRTRREWAAIPASERGALLYATAAELGRARERIAALITRDMGKVLPESRAEVDAAAEFLRFMAGEGSRLVGEVRPSGDPRRLAMVERVPIGVAAAITPWNFPLLIPVWKVATALVTGNTVVLKPAVQTARIAVALAEALLHAGVPEGAFALVTGRGGVVGDRLARHPDVGVVSFTGSTEVGLELGGAVGRRGGRASLEMGGKNVAVVLADADLEQAITAIGAAAFSTTGQRCTAVSRVVVESEIFEDVADALAAHADSLVVAPGDAPDADIGPLVDAASRDRVAAAVAQATQRGAKVLAGGRSPDDLPLQGAFYRPTVVVDAAADDPIVREELFGPVVAVLSAADSAEALRIANDSVYGLSASVFTRDLGSALEMGRQLEAGMVFVNAATTDSEQHLPFGGVKASGNGSRDTGAAALDAYTEWKSVYLAPPCPRVCPQKEVGDV